MIAALPAAEYVTILNIASEANLSYKLDLKKIARKALNAKYKGAYVIMRIGNPRTTALIYSNGKIRCTGAKTEEDSWRAVTKYARIIQMLGFNVNIRDFKIVNIVGYCDVQFPIRLGVLKLVHHQFCLYEPELPKYPYLIYSMVQPSIKMAISSSGKVIFIGAKVRQELYEAFNYIYPILNKFKKQ